MIGKFWSLCLFLSAGKPLPYLYRILKEIKINIYKILRNW